MTISVGKLLLLLLCYSVSRTDQASELYAPIMPFITEEIYQGLYADNISIHISKWPQSQAEYLLTDSEQSIIDELFRIIEAVRAYKSQNAISLGKEIEEFTYTSSQDLTPYHQFLEKSLRVAHIVQKK